MTMPRRPGRRALVFAGGDPVRDLEALLREPEGAADDASREVLPDLVVCADRGLVHCLDSGRIPDRLVGDFDSVPPELLDSPDYRDVERFTYPSDKAASDLELALLSLVERPFGAAATGEASGRTGRAGEAEETFVPDRVVVLGVSGGRTDHLLFNWMLPLAHPWPFALRLVDDTVDATVVTPERPWRATLAPGTTLSLLSLATATGVDASGLAYPLRGATLEPGGTLGLSNVVADEAPYEAPDEVRVAVTSGVLLALAVRPSSS